MNLYNKRRCLSVCLSICIYVPYDIRNIDTDRQTDMAGQTAEMIETKLDTRTHVHPGSVSVKVNVKVIRVCVREWQNYETPVSLRESDTWRTLLKLRPDDGGRRHLANAYENPSGRRVITAWVTRRGAAGAEQRAPKARAELRRTDNYS